jgi:hypothetical protein
MTTSVVYQLFATGHICPHTGALLFNTSNWRACGLMDYKAAKKAGFRGSDVK